MNVFIYLVVFKSLVIQLRLYQHLASLRAANIQVGAPPMIRLLTDFKGPLRISSLGPSH